MNTKNFTGGLLLGAAVGLMAGILLAPEKGSDIVKKLSDGVKDKLNRLKGDTQDWAEDVKSDAKYLADNGGKKVEELSKGM